MKKIIIYILLSLVLLQAAFAVNVCRYGSDNGFSLTDPSCKINPQDLNLDSTSASFQCKVVGQNALSSNIREAYVDLDVSVLTEEEPPIYPSLITGNVVLNSAEAISCSQLNCPSDNNPCTNDCSIVNGQAVCAKTNYVIEDKISCQVGGKTGTCNLGRCDYGCLDSDRGMSPYVFGSIFDPFFVSSEKPLLQDLCLSENILFEYSCKYFSGFENGTPAGFYSTITRFNCAPGSCINGKCKTEVELPPYLESLLASYDDETRFIEVNSFAYGFSDGKIRLECEQFESEKNTSVNASLSNLVVSTNNLNLTIKADFAGSNSDSPIMKVDVYQFENLTTKLYSSQALFREAKSSITIPLFTAGTYYVKVSCLWSQELKNKYAACNAPDDVYVVYATEDLSYACGDQELSMFEDCEGDNLRDSSCESKGYDFGSLSCKACKFDFTGCQQNSIEPSLIMIQDYIEVSGNKLILQPKILSQDEEEAYTGFVKVEIYDKTSVGSFQRSTHDRASYSNLLKSQKDFELEYVVSKGEKKIILGCRYYRPDFSIANCGSKQFGLIVD